MTEGTILLRQVHPSYVENDGASSQAFFPFPKDKNKLSVDDGDRTSAEAAFEFYTNVLELASDGTWGVSGAEVTSTGLSYLPDALENNASHALIDFGDRNEKECRKLARKLKAFANARKRLYPPL
jgi:hypothetical protein